MAQLASFDYWEISFDEDGKADPQSAVDNLLKEVPTTGITDLFIFSHGWNNDRTMAHDIYERFFLKMKDLVTGEATARSGIKIGIVGVFWPSRIWSDETAVPRAGGTASVAGRPSNEELVKDLKTVFTKAGQHDTLDKLAKLLRDQPKDEEELKRFHQLMRTLTAGGDVADAPEDNGETSGLLNDDPMKVFKRFAALAPARRVEGAAGVADTFERLWEGAKEALRQATYYTMKKRAGIVGKEGLGPIIGRLHTDSPNLRVHLIGHSFGARVVSFALSGLLVDGAAKSSDSPVKSLSLLQGAFSHFAFAEKLPHDLKRSGALKGMATRVDGPIIVTHSKKDLAVGKYYPYASLAGRQDAADAADPLYQWGAMGHDGAQAVSASEETLGKVGTTYPFAGGKFVNLDGNAIITNGDPPSGAHSDIFHPEIAWAVASGAGVVVRK